MNITNSYHIALQGMDMGHKKIATSSVMLATYMDKAMLGLGPPIKYSKYPNGITIW
jgi:hypothetical protein